MHAASLSLPPSLTSLARFARRARRADDGERCELCGAAITNPHPHVVDRADRRLLCACTACSLTFVGVVEGRHRTVPNRVRAEDRGAISLSDLQALGVPVGLAFFFRPSALGRWVGVFPSPAGPTEAELREQSWSALANKSTLVGAIQDDVEALLVRSERSGRCTVLAVPIDVCYELTALLRREWRGIDGGDDARRALDSFFDDLETRARERKGTSS
jgi:hypothetical protein